MIYSSHGNADPEYKVIKYTRRNAWCICIFFGPVLFFERCWEKRTGGVKRYAEMEKEGKGLFVPKDATTLVGLTQCVIQDIFGGLSRRGCCFCIER